MREHFLSLRKGPAFFDEDDACTGSESDAAACLNRYEAAAERPWGGYRVAMGQPQSGHGAAMGQPIS